MVENNEIKILIVEDSITQAVKLQYILERNGYCVTSAKNGKEALASIEQHSPTIVITDVIMPEMNGYQLCEQIKENKHYKGIPVILLTSLSSPEDVIRGLQCKANNFVVKPYDEKLLLSRIKYILANEELRKSAMPEMGIEIIFAGHRHFITSDRIQIIDMLLSTYESAIRQTGELKESNAELKKAFENIKILEKNYRTLLESNSDAIVVVDYDRKIHYVNPSAETLFGRRSETLLGELFEFPITEDRTNEVKIVRNAKEEAMAEMKFVKINWGGKNAYLATLRDVTENVRLREELRSLSITDELTGLYNRRGFFTLAKQELMMANRIRKGFYILYADLDNMKWINDNLGHHEGDRAIIEIAEILKKTFRKSDIISRMGGDEFAVMVIGANEVSSDIVTSHLQECLNNSNTRNKRSCQLSLTVGMVYYDPEQPRTLDELISRADGLMYEQKRRKKSRVDVPKRK